MENAIVGLIALALIVSHHYDHPAGKILRNSAMKILDWLQLALFVAALLAITKPLGIYLCQVLDVNGRTFLDPSSSRSSG